MKRKRLTRVLALDLHPRRFGYVVLEGPGRLLFWRVFAIRGKRHAGDALIRRRLGRLLAKWSPSAVLVHNPRRERARENFLKQIRTEAKRRGIPVRTLDAEGIEHRDKGSTHYENARRVAERFPVLRWELPPKRRAWESEHYRTSIFAAASSAMTSSWRNSQHGMLVSAPPQNLAKI
jgi:hypothetical protein